MKAIMDQSRAAERAVVGAAILDGAAIDAFADEVRVDDFVAPPVAEVWARLVTLRADPLVTALPPADWFAAVLTAAWAWGEESPRGTFGPTLVSELASGGPTVMGAVYQLRVMQRLAVTRRLLHSLAVASEAIVRGDDLGSAVAALIPVVTASIPKTPTDVPPHLPKGPQ